MTIRASRTIAGAAILGILILGFLYFSKYASAPEVASFEECKALGYPIMESYPEQCSTPDGKIFTNTVATSTSPTTPNATSTLSSGVYGPVRVNISANQIVSSPLMITGDVTGGWYFEASFPVELVDGNGKRLAAGPAQAQSDWMTSARVPFALTLTFAKPSTATGTLILRNDNPSGLPENQQEIRIPVRFATTERVVKVYYYNETLDKDIEGNVLCSAKGLVSLDRVVPATQTPLQDAIRLLLRGEVTAAEKSAGITTEFPLSGVSLTSASLPTSGALVLTLADPEGRTNGGSCRVQVLRAQVEATARQFGTVKSVTFSPETLFQP